MKEKQEKKIGPEFPQGAGNAEEPKKKRSREAESGAEGEDLDYCRFAADPEHERGYREEEPCDDARAGEYEKRTENEKKAR